MYLRLTLVVVEEYRHVVESKLRACVGDAIRVVSICGSIEEARIRAALVEPDVIVIGPGHGLAEVRTLVRADSVTAPLLVIWGDCLDGSSQGADGIAGYLSNDSPVDAVVTVFELCARRIAQRRAMRTTVIRHPESSYRSDIIALPHQHGIDVRRTESIIHVKGEGNYTQVTFDKGGDIIMSRTIGDYEDVLPEGTFLRVHRSHIINIHHVRKIVRGKMMRVQLSNGDEVEVSDSKRDALLRMINVVRRR